MPKAAAKSSAKCGQDINKPKRPLSAFLLFSNAQRGEVKKKHPEWKIGDIAKELGRVWGTMNDAQKQKYQSEAAKLKDNYNALIGKKK